jgi:cytochrome c
MWSLQVNKIFAAVLAAVWLIWLVDFIGDLAVPAAQPDHRPVATPKAGKPSAEEKKAPAQITKQAAKQASKPAAAADPVLAAIAASDAKRGRKLTKKCTACHTLKKGAKNRIGPNIWGAVGGPRGAVAGFKYSTALKALGGRWSYQDLDKYLTKPKAFLPKGKMAFPGMKKAGDRAALIKYLRTLSDKPLALP